MCWPVIDKNGEVFLQKFHRNISPSSEADISVLSLESNDIETFVQEGYLYSWDSEESTKCFPSEDTSIFSSMGKLNVNSIQISSTTFVSQIEFLDFVHNWTLSEEVLLIILRSDMESKFVGAKSHETLWNEIQKKMEKQGEVIDANNKTGNNAVSWKHYDKFNECMGSKPPQNYKHLMIQVFKEHQLNYMLKPNEGEKDIAKPSCSGINASEKSAKKKEKGLNFMTLLKNQ
ncbi:unnamed protein product [Mytilus coruscus]|uniref:Uncharacterized protein n=1 Tax=Mytilus coruscus TaxID=42192 RepID=A0A6J8DGP8_MYTCO|nr:unnamed protein product [Mytilus coruscus]